MDLKETVLESEWSESDFLVVGCFEYGIEPSVSTEFGDSFALGKMRWEGVISVESSGSLVTPSATQMSDKLG
jgi:hypothetical protein